jgi:hypothetical protein
LVEMLLGFGKNVYAHVAKALIRVAALLARRVLDEDFVPIPHQLDAGSRNEADAPLPGLQLTGNSNAHV